MVFVCVEKRPKEGYPIDGMTESTVTIVGRGDGLSPSNGTGSVQGIKSPVYAINGHGSLRSAHRFGSTYGSFSNSCLGTSLSSMRIKSETANEYRSSPLAAESHI